MATKTSRIPRNLNFLGETAFLGGLSFRKLQIVTWLSFRKLQIFISQTTDSHFANYRFSFHKLQIFISFRSISFHFALFCFANYSKPMNSFICLSVIKFSRPFFLLKGRCHHICATTFQGIVLNSIWETYYFEFKRVCLKASYMYNLLVWTNTEQVYVHQNSCNPTCQEMNFIYCFIQSKMLGAIQRGFIMPL